MSWLIFFGFNYIVLSHAHYMRVPCNRRRFQPPVITTILRNFLPSQYHPYFSGVAPQYSKNDDFQKDDDPNFAKLELPPQLLAGGPRRGTVGPRVGTVGPGLGTVGQQVRTVGPELRSGGPDLGAGPQVGTMGLEADTMEPELETIGPRLGVAGNKIEEDNAKALRCAQLPCPADELGPPVCACNYVTGKVATFQDMCDVKRHNCRYDTVFKVFLNAICPWEFKTRRVIGKPFIDYSDSKYYN